MARKRPLPKDSKPLVGSRPTKASKRRTTTAPVQRDVGLQSKGPRLQRLRAVLLLLRASAHYPETRQSVAVELHGDVYSMTSDDAGVRSYHEENKNYSPTSAFSFSSFEILNSLVSFCDCWIYNTFSPNVHFGFYTPNNYAKENSTQRTKSLGITWPDEPILQLLEQGRCEHPGLIAAVRQSIIDSYTQQSAAHNSSQGTDVLAPQSLSHLALITTWPDSQWLAFLKQIEWKFREEDADTIEQSVIDAIQASPYYNSQLAGKEWQIVTLLIDMIDKRQSSKDVTQRLVHVTEAILAFKQVESGTVELPDPAWELWKQLSPPTDTRNLSDKVQAVCPNANSSDLSVWSRRAAQSLLEQRAFGDDKRVLALKYQVFDACDEHLIALRSTITGDSLQCDTVTDWMAALCNTAKARFDDCSKQYAYPVKSESSVKSLVYDLFDSCFLSFDGGNAS